MPEKSKAQHSAKSKTDKHAKDLDRQQKQEGKPEKADKSTRKGAAPAKGGDKGNVRASKGMEAMSVQKPASKTAEKGAAKGGKAAALAGKKDKPGKGKKGRGGKDSEKGSEEESDEETDAEEDGPAAAAEPGADAATDEEEDADPAALADDEDEDEDLPPGKKGSKATERKEVKDLLAVGRDKGFLTYDEVNDALPADIVSSDQIDDVMSMFGDNDIAIVDEANKVKLPEAKPPDPEPTPVKPEAEEEEEKAQQEEDDAFSKSNDPVRMYLRKMGSVSLLTREGEVEIAKRIEDGEKEVLDAVLHSSIAIKEIIQIGERLRKGKMRVREVIRDAPDEDDESFDEAGRAEQVAKLIDKIRKHESDNEKLHEQLDAKGKKLSDAKKKELKEAVERNEQKMAEDLAEIKLNKRQIERIIENL
jgi:RNA polymerase primary sigma factor